MLKNSVEKLDSRLLFFVSILMEMSLVFHQFLFPISLWFLGMTAESIKCFFGGSNAEIL